LKYKCADFDRIKLFVQQKGGVLISDTYKNNRSLLEVECSLKHKWNICWANMQRGRWCPTCNKNKKLDIDFANKIASDRGGKCLSTEYKNTGSKLLWECKNKHQFLMKLNAINSRNNWCPYCSFWTSEEICRHTFETIFQKKFVRIRPKWLKNKCGNYLELDGYCEDLKLAFEHNGTQHYENKKYNKLYSDKFAKIQEHDHIKKELCNNNGVKLIIIPQLFSMTKIDNLKQIIKKECNDLNFLPQNFDNIVIDYSKLFFESKLKKYIDIAISFGYCYISGDYLNNQSEITLSCKNNHQFKTSCLLIKRRSRNKNINWCQECIEKK
jgi:hypothetical protein